jgi:[ribosomal protein S5]-alanine N-acetyltransferase
MHLRDGEEDKRGFWVDRGWQGHGFGAEACVAATDYWFGMLGRIVLRAPQAAGNIASRRISEKTGMRMIRMEERDYVSGRLPAEIWEITVEEWRRRPVAEARDAV